MNEVFFKATFVNGRVETTGQPVCFLGHRIPGERGAIDDGIFAEWRWAEDSLTVRTDRYGYFPLYYYAYQDVIMVAPSIMTLIKQGASVEIDFQALSIYLGLGYFIQDETPFRFIKSLPANGRLEWHKGNLKVSGEPFIGKLNDLSRDDAIDGYISLFRKSIERRLPDDENFAIPLSAGRDSRHILFEILRQGYQPKYCVTATHFPLLPEREVPVASYLTNLLGLQHVILEQPDAFSSELIKNVLTNFCSDEHRGYLPVCEFLEGKVHTIYDGIGGDVLSNGLFLTQEKLSLYESGRFFDLAQRLFLKRKSGFFSKFFLAFGQGQLNFRIAVERLSEELKKYSEAPNPVGAFYFWNRTRREVALAPYAIFSTVGKVYSPYLDHDLYDFLASLPARMFLDHEFHTNAIQRAYPQHAHVPFEDKKIMQRISREFYRAFLFKTGKYMFSHPGMERSLVKKAPLITSWLFAMLGSTFTNMGLFLNPILVLYLLQLEMVVPKPSR